MKSTSKNRSSRRKKPTSNFVIFSASVEDAVLKDAKTMATICGFTGSFSAYVNDALKRDALNRRAQLMAPSMMGYHPMAQGAPLSAMPPMPAGRF